MKSSHLHSPSTSRAWSHSLSYARCEICVDRCSMDAISMTEDQVASIDLHRCIGCGLCINTCPEEALTLAAKPEEKHREPPPTNRFMRSPQDIESILS